jgi:hypothetical protein
VKRALGCTVFVLIGLAWLAYTGFDLFIHLWGNCGDDPLCDALKDAIGGRIMWRGFAVGLLLIIAYAAYRHIYEDEDVQ